ncbi:hypothetical protein CK203_008624 [Vitis vinifera]|uniref:Uncharacterized protein n=1 Tax=Vitis vinifera TaxID=29760 RepID=A0A438KE23_VITVI|nr:hypothetical protein CK203_008624 [Vitis vinifera]
MVIAEDTTRLKKIMEQERVFQFLVGLNLELEQVRVQTLGKEPLPPLRELGGKGGSSRGKPVTRSGQVHQVATIDLPLENIPATEQEPILLSKEHHEKSERECERERVSAAASELVRKEKDEITLAREMKIRRGLEGGEGGAGSQLNPRCLRGKPQIFIKESKGGVSSWVRMEVESLGFLMEDLNHCIRDEKEDRWVKDWKE